MAGDADISLFVECVMRDENALEQLRTIMASGQQSQHFAVKMSGTHIAHVDHRLGNLLLQRPVLTLPRVDEALRRVQKELASRRPAGVPRLTLKPNVHARICWIPAGPEYNRPNVSSLRSSDIGRLVSVTGTVILPRKSVRCLVSSGTLYGFKSHSSRCTGRALWQRVNAGIVA